jgi:molybdenum cofactor biosynthesis enzyme MoaA
LIDGFTQIVQAAGEITINPKLDEIVSLLSGYSSKIYSNCVIYSDALYNCLKQGNMMINTSVDAGTRETFAKIKGVDRFEQVCGNIRRYAKAGMVELKYIFLPGINDNEADVDGFIGFIEDILNDCGNIASVIVTKNYRILSPLGEHTLNMIKRLLSAAKARSLMTHIADNNFLPGDLARLPGRVADEKHSID